MSRVVLSSFPRLVSHILRPYPLRVERAAKWYVSETRLRGTDRGWSRWSPVSHDVTTMSSVISSRYEGSTKGKRIRKVIGSRLDDAFPWMKFLPYQQSISRSKRLTISTFLSLSRGMILCQYEGGKWVTNWTVTELTENHHVTRGSLCISLSLLSLCPQSRAWASVSVS